MRDLIYFDSGVLLNYINYHHGFKRVNIKNKFNIADLSPTKAGVLISDISIIELTEHLKDSKASLLAINEGYSYFDLCKHRIDAIELNEEEINEIDNVVDNDLMSLPQIVGALSKGFNSTEIKFLVQICKQYSIFLIDALHFLIADRENCKMFVTTDNELKQSLEKLIKDSSLKANMEIVSSKEFKSSILNRLK
jgi:hypothetical protein